MRGLTLDTGVLVAIERGGHRARAIVTAAKRRGDRITVPTVVIVEWWRGQRGQPARLLDAFAAIRRGPRCAPFHCALMTSPVGTETFVTRTLSIVA